MPVGEKHFELLGKDKDFWILKMEGRKTGLYNRERALASTQLEKNETTSHLLGR